MPDDKYLDIRDLEPLLLAVGERGGGIRGAIDQPELFEHGHGAIVQNPARARKHQAWE